MDRVPGKRDARGDVEVAGFIEAGHDGLTGALRDCCIGTLRPAVSLAPFVGLGALAACSGEYSALAPAGPAAARVEELWTIMLWGAGAILGGVMATALYALATASRERHFSTRRVLTGWGLVFPAVTLSALMALAFLRGEQLLARAEDRPTAIRVHAEQWRWRFAYPGGERSEGVLHVPAGEDFTVIVTSGDVIHSFWVPRLGGKMDAVPGRRNALRLRADRPGTYYGQCSEYCGTGHAHMQFVVVAHAPADYPAALAAADDRTLGPLPVLDQRPPPAGRRIEDGARAIFEALGLS